MRFSQTRSINQDTQGATNAKSISSNALVLLTKIWQNITAIIHHVFAVKSHQKRHTPVSFQNRKVQNTKSLAGSKRIEPQQTYYKSRRLPKPKMLSIWRLSPIYDPQENKKGDRQHQSLPPYEQRHHRQLVTN